MALCLFVKEYRKIVISTDVIDVSIDFAGKVI